MALTNSSDILRTVVGNKRIVVCNILFDSSYPTGGESLTPAMVGLSSIDSVHVHPHASRIGVYDNTNKKILLYTALGTEASNTSDQSSITVKATIYGN